MESDIIAATPFADTVASDNDIVNATPEKFAKKSWKNSVKVKRKIEKNTEETLVGCLKLVDKYKIHETAVGSVHYNKPYIYFDIKEIREFTNQTVLKHNNVHLIGIYKFDSKFGQILSNSQEIDFNGIIELNFKLLTDIPVEENVISVYGSIEYENHPVLLVKFFRTENAGYLKQYKESLKFVRNFVPRCYFEIFSTW